MQLRASLSGRASSDPHRPSELETLANLEHEAATLSLADPLHFALGLCNDELRSFEEALRGAGREDLIATRQEAQ